MAEFDQFTGAEQPQQEEDPAAAFLAREQDDFAELEQHDVNDAAPATEAGMAQPISSDGKVYTTPPYTWYTGTSP